ncbi:hypothetical protein RSAG8_00146, partial [Rhizoctonia solani AG-8 WAC10335]
MRFTRFVSLLATIAFASVFVAASPAAFGCNSGEQVLKLVKNLHDEVRETLMSLDNCYTSGSNPTDIFTQLASKVDRSNSAMAAAGVDGTDLDPKTAVQVQVSDITAKMILDISTGCSKFQKVEIKDFDYAALSSKIDMALKGLCIGLDELIDGCLSLISSICLPNSMLLWAANMKHCLSTLAANLI